MSQTKKSKEKVNCLKCKRMDWGLYVYTFKPEVGTRFVPKVSCSLLNVICWANEGLVPTEASLV